MKSVSEFMNLAEHGRGLVSAVSYFTLPPQKFKNLIATTYILFRFLVKNWPDTAAYPWAYGAYHSESETVTSTFENLLRRLPYSIWRILVRLWTTGKCMRRYCSTAHAQARAE